MIRVCRHIFQCKQVMWTEWRANDGGGRLLVLTGERGVHVPFQEAPSLPHLGLLVLTLGCGRFLLLRSSSSSRYSWTHSKETHEESLSVKEKRGFPRCEESIQQWSPRMDELTLVCICSRFALLAKTVGHCNFNKTERLEMLRIYQRSSIQNVLLRNKQNAANWRDDPAQWAVPVPTGGSVFSSQSSPFFSVCSGGPSTTASALALALACRRNTVCRGLAPCLL